MPTYLAMVKVVLCMLVTVLSSMAVRLDADTIMNSSDQLDLLSSGYQFQYGVIVDCGSTGTRFKVYKWRPSVNGGLPHVAQVTDEKGNPLSHSSTPGLPDVAKSGNLREYLKKGLDFSAKHVPKVQHKDTHIYMFATAGMRILPAEESIGVWDKVHGILKSSDNVFSFTNVKQARTIVGEEEALFDWISTAYIHSYLENHKGGPQTGALDMGGASFQVAFQTLPAPLPNFLELQLSLKEYKLYTKSYLGWGKNEAKKQHFYKLAAKNGPGVTHFSDPCYWTGSQQHVHIKNVTFHVSGEGNFYNCKRHLSSLMEKDTYCALEPCALKGVFQPKIPSNIELYAMDNFFQAAMLFQCDGYHPIFCLTEKASVVCDSTDWKNAKKVLRKTGKKNAHVTEETVRDACFSAAYVSTLLVEGLNLSPNRRVHFLARLANTDMDWTIGAMIYHSVQASHN
eukprot:CFRG1054T1